MRVCSVIEFSILSGVQKNRFLFPPREYGCISCKTLLQPNKDIFAKVFNKNNQDKISHLRNIFLTVNK